MDLLDGWLVNPGWMPHGFCLRWSPGLVAALVISNGLIGLSYY